MRPITSAFPGWTDLENSHPSENKEQRTRREAATPTSLSVGGVLSEFTAPPPFPQLPPLVGVRSL